MVSPNRLAAAPALSAAVNAIPSKPMTRMIHSNDIRSALEMHTVRPYRPHDHLDLKESLVIGPLSTGVSDPLPAPEPVTLVAPVILLVVLVPFEA